MTIYFVVKINNEMRIIYTVFSPPKKNPLPMLLLLLLFMVPTSQALRFHSIFGDRMVLQREATNTVWGFGELLPGTEARLLCQENGRALRPVLLRPKVLAGGTWQVDLPPQATGSRQYHHYHPLYNIHHT